MTITAAQIVAAGTLTVPVAGAPQSSQDAPRVLPCRGHAQRPSVDSDIRIEVWSPAASAWNGWYMGAMYRLLETHGESRERRDQLQHPPYQKPELLASEANPGEMDGVSPLLILDVFSRYVVGWMIAHRESAELAKRPIEHSCHAQHIKPGQLTVHADRRSSMKSKPVASLLADLDRSSFDTVLIRFGI